MTAKRVIRDTYYCDRNLVHGGYIRLRQSGVAAFGEIAIAVATYLSAKG